MNEPTLTPAPVTEPVAPAPVDPLAAAPETDAGGAQLAPMQRAQFSILQQQGKLNTNLQAGIERNPIALRADADEANLSPGQFAVGRDGIRRQVSAESIAAQAAVNTRMTEQNDEWGRQYPLVYQAMEQALAYGRQGLEAGGRVVDMVKAAPADIGNIPAIMQGVGSGLLKGAGETAEAVNQFADMLDEKANLIPAFGNIYNAGVAWDEGLQNIRFVNGREMTRIRAINGDAFYRKYDTPLGAIPFFGGMLDDITKFSPDTVSGNLAKGISQFVVPMRLAGKLMGGLRGATGLGTAARFVAAGAAGDFFGFEPSDPRVSNILVDKFPVLENTIVGYLAGDEDDSALEGRLKNVLEGVAMTGMLEGLMRGIKAGRVALRDAAARDPAAAARMEAEVARTQQAATDRALQDEQMRALLGDPADDLVVIASRVGRDAVADLAPEAVAAARNTVANGPAVADAVGKLDGQGKLLADQVTPNGAAASLPFRVNLSRINTEDDVKAVLVAMTEANIKEVQSARRGVQTFEQTAQAAKNVDVLRVLNEWKPGQAVNAETGLALRNLEATVAQQFTDATKALFAGEGLPSAAQLLAWKRVAAVSGLVSSVARGATAEAGRALNAMKIPAGSNRASLAAARMALDAQGGFEALFKAAQDIHARIKDGDVIGADELAELSKTTMGARLMTFSQVTKLANVKTQMRNILGNTITQFMEISSRDTAGRIARTLGDIGPDSVQIGESGVMMASLLPAMLDFWKAGANVNNIDTAAGRAARGLSPMAQEGARGEAIIFSSKEWADGINDPVFARDGSISMKAALRSLARTADGVAGGVFNFMEGADSMFKYMAVNSELRAQAFRRAAHEIDSGAFKASQSAERMDFHFNNPTDDMIESAARYAEETTFTRPHLNGKFGSMDRESGFGRGVMDIRQRMVDGVFNTENMSPIAALGAKTANLGASVTASQLLPFIATPVNIASYVGRSSPLAPMFGRYLEDIAAGGSRAQIAEARMLQGSVLTFAAFSLGIEGYITGDSPANPEAAAQERRMGMPAYSLRFPQEDADGNKSVVNVSLRGISPISDILRLGAMAGDMFRRTDLLDDGARDTFGEVMGAIALSLAPSFMEQSSLTGITQIIDAVGSRDPNAAEAFFSNMGASMVVPSIVGQAEQWTNADVEATHNLMSSIIARIPGERTIFDDDGLAVDDVRRDMWGRAINTSTGTGAFGDFLNSMVTPASFERIEVRTLDEAIQDADDRYSAIMGDGDRDKRASRSINLVDVELRRLNRELRPKARTITYQSELIDGQEVSVQLEDMPEIYNWMQARAGPLAERNILEAMREPSYARLNAQEQFEVIKKGYNEAYKPVMDILQNFDTPLNPFRERLEREFKKRDALIVENRQRGFIDQATR